MLPLLLELFTGTVGILKTHILPLFSTRTKPAVLKELLSVTPTVICMLSNPYRKIVTWNDSLNISICCTKCTSANDNENSYEIVCNQIVENTNLKSTLLNCFAKFCENGRIEQNKEIINYLPSIANHMDTKTCNIFGAFVKLSGNKNKDVRDYFANIAGKFVFNWLVSILHVEIINSYIIQLIVFLNRKMIC